MIDKPLFPFFSSLDCECSYNTFKVTSQLYLNVVQRTTHRGTRGNRDTPSNRKKFMSIKYKKYQTIEKKGNF